MSLGPDPGRAVVKPPGVWGQVVSLVCPGDGVWLGGSSQEFRARPRGAHAGLPGRLAPWRGQDAEPSASLPCWAGRAMCRVSWGQGPQQRPQNPTSPTCSCLQERKVWVTCRGWCSSRVRGPGGPLPGSTQGPGRWKIRAKAPRRKRVPALSTRCRGHLETAQAPEAVALPTPCQGHRRQAGPGPSGCEFHSDV